MAGLGFGAQKVVMSAAVQPATRSWCWKRPAQTEHEWFMLSPPALPWPSQWVAMRALLQVLLPESAQRTAAASSSQACVVVVPPMMGGPWRRCPRAGGAGGGPLPVRLGSMRGT